MTHNFLRRYRRRGALSQRDVAALLGDGCATVVSRHEAATRPPSLKTALAYQAIFGVPVHELFPADYRDAELRVLQRAKVLRDKLDANSTDAKSVFKVKFLSKLGSDKPRLSANKHDQHNDRR